MDVPDSSALGRALGLVWQGEVDVGDGIIPIALAGDGPPLILLHGWTLNWRMWLPQVEALGAQFTLVMPDRRGFGRSTAPPDLAREADDVERIADFLGFPRYALLGLSQGASIALDCAHGHGWRIAALVLSGAPLPMLVPRDEVIDLDRYRALARDGDMASMRGEWKGHRLMHCANSAATALVEEMLDDYEGRDLVAPSQVPGVPVVALEHLPMPLLAMTGDSDTAWRQACASALAATAPRAQHALIEGAGHLANLDQPARFNRSVSDFLLGCGYGKTA